MCACVQSLVAPSIWRYSVGIVVASTALGLNRSKDRKCWTQKKRLFYCQIETGLHNNAAMSLKQHYSRTDMFCNMAPPLCEAAVHYAPLSKIWTAVHEHLLLSQSVMHFVREIIPSHRSGKCKFELLPHIVSIRINKEIFVLTTTFQSKTRLRS